jgi:hypothetical protein
MAPECGNPHPIDAEVAEDLHLVVDVLARRAEQHLVVHDRDLRRAVGRRGSGEGEQQGEHGKERRGAEMSGGGQHRPPR